MRKKLSLGNVLKERLKNYQKTPQIESRGKQLPGPIRIFTPSKLSFSHKNIRFNNLRPTPSL